MKKNVLMVKSYNFSIKIVKIYLYLARGKKEYVLSKQLVRSGTAIGANIEEAIGGQSRKDFLSKLSISYKEARETHYWLRLIYNTGFITKNELQSVLDDCNELLRIIGSIQKTIKGRNS